MLEGKVAIITGSTRGIGLAVARALAREKASVLLNGFGDPARIEKNRAAMAEEFGVRVAYDGADVAQAAQAARLAQSAMREFGQIDILINNAGINHSAPVDRFPAERWDAVIAVNLSAAFHSIRTTLPIMRRRNWGRIVNIASVLGLAGEIDQVAYVASKHGLVGLTKAVALEAAASNITCNAICPGLVASKFLDKMIGEIAQRDSVPLEAARRKLLSPQPSGVTVSGEQIAALAVFLCSEAAAQVRGAALAIDGGWTAK